MEKGFEAVYDKDSEILILGSFPSVKSRELGFYYGHKQNRFWKMLSAIFNEEIRDDIVCKKEFVLRHHIALYDVVAKSDLKGSADVDLENSNFAVASIDFLLSPNTKVNKILCNGKTAYEILLKTFKSKIPVYYMSSTSSANPRFKIEDWKAIILNK